MSLILNQQLFGETYLRMLRASKGPADTADAARQTMAEWRAEIPSLDNLPSLGMYLSQAFSALGFAYSRPVADRFVLYADETRDRPLGLCLAVTDSCLGRTAKGRHHQARLVRLLREEGLSWGILTNGSRWRLCHAESPAPYETYLEADLDSLLDASSLPEFVLFHRLFSRVSWEYEEDVHGLNRALAASDKAVEAVERHLKGRVEDVLQSLCLGFVADESASSYDRAALDEIYRNAIYLLYRVLFLYYAEARGLLPVNNPAYTQVSLRSIVDLAYRRQRLGEHNPDGYSLWKRLTRLCVAVDEGSEEVGISAYNGGLFNDDEKPYLRHHKIQDSYLAPALYDLGYVEGKGDPQPIEYRDLSVRHLGTLYEGLLEYKLNLVGSEPVVVRESGGKRTYIPQSEAGPVRRSETLLQPGSVYFADDKGERKASGSYYTPEDVVQYIVGNTVTPKLEEVRDSLRPLMEEAERELKVAPTHEEWARIQAFADARVLAAVEHRMLGLRILDPAMGSGHFLVATAQVMTNYIVETLNLTEWPNDRIDADPLLWKRRVVERCLYGVDLNPLAQELAKLGLWITSAVNSKPLTFLDHHLKVGNSLYGTPLSRLAGLPSAKQPKDDPLSKLLREATITQILEDLAQVSGRDSEDLASVKAKGDAFQHAEQKAQRPRDIANVWLASLFGLSITQAKYTDLLQDVTRDYSPEAWEAKVEAEPLILGARKIAKDEAFFHWELEFPDAVVDGECRFDAVVANPPYVGTRANAAITVLYETAKCGDLYAWFFEVALRTTEGTGNVGTVVPLSLMFSRQTRSLRAAIVERSGAFYFSAFDSNNSGLASIFANPNAANCQRAAIALLRGSDEGGHTIFSTNLLRWKESERTGLLERIQYADVTPFAGVEGFPRLGDPRLAEFWRRASSYGNTIRDHLYGPKGGNGRTPTLYPLYVPDVARYFITAMPWNFKRSKINVFSFESEWIRDVAMVVVNSNVFYWLWLVLGDGFDVTASNIAAMVLPRVPVNEAETVKLRDSLLQAAGSCATYQIKWGERIPNYNFNKRMDLLLEIDDWIVRHVAPGMNLPRDIFAQYKSSSFLRPLDLSALMTADAAVAE